MAKVATVSTGTKTNPTATTARKFYSKKMPLLEQNMDFVYLAYK